MGVLRYIRCICFSRCVSRAVFSGKVTNLTDDLALVGGFLCLALVVVLVLSAYYRVDRLGGALKLMPDRNTSGTVVHTI